ncbi:fungal trichothecene efflux pump [Dactylonectria macrodidyma]|uniref:Fungal trichothecene efflux pump n=1 Tax=Dactylonectria macrodidyma TaxID=307937 RepID=A0A9P9DPE8_9HYPO|nr:fungal trichothecene efflux pump [Dactylonectria macrodidyma]
MEDIEGVLGENREGNGKETAYQHHEQASLNRQTLEASMEHTAVPASAERLSWMTVTAIFFLGLSLVAPISLVVGLTSAILTQIALDLNDLDSIPWLVGSYGISSSVAYGIAGNLSDVFGRRYTMILGNLMLLVGSIVGGVAQNMGTLIAAMAIGGFASGLIFVAYAGISELVPKKYRGVGLGWAEFAMILPWGALSVFLANKINSSATWRWIFYISIIYCVLCSVGLAIFYFPPSRPQEDYEKSRLDEFLSIDFVGVALYTAGLTTFLVGLTWADTSGHPWNSASVIAPIVAGIVAVGVAFAYDFTVAKQPFFPPSLFAQWRQFTVLLVVIFVTGMCYFALTTQLPQVALYVYRNNPTDIGITCIPGGLGQLFFGAIAPLLIHRLKHVKLQLIAILTLQAAAVGLLSVTVPHHRAGFMVLQFFAQGCFPWIVVTTYLTASLHAPQKQIGLAIGLVGTFRSAGGSFGNAIFSTILRSVVDDKLVPEISAAALAAGVPSSELEALIPATFQAGYGTPDTFAAIPAATLQVQRAVMEAFSGAYGYAYKRVFWGLMAFNILAIGVACLIRDPSHLLTNQTSVYMEKQALGRGRTEKPTDEV